MPDPFHRGPRRSPVPGVERRSGDKVKKRSFEQCALQRWKTSGSGYLRRVRRKAKDEDEDSHEFELTVGLHL